MKAIVNETKKFNAAISGAGAHDSRALEDIFEKCRHDEKKMTTLVRAICEASASFCRQLGQVSGHFQS